MCIDASFPSGLTAAEVLENGTIASSMWRMLLSVRDWQGPSPVPGQFLMLRVSDGADPLLGRPFGFAGFRREEDGAAIEILYRVTGRGTAAMAGWGAGQKVRFLGPLGKGFDLPPPGSRAVLLAGGIGLPPLLFLARELAALGRAGEITLAYSEPSCDRFFPLESCPLEGMEVQFCTRDGSRGRVGRVTQWLQEQGDLTGAYLYSCGPGAMMRDIFKIVSGMDLTAQYSLEARMACGFGVCAGCAVPVPVDGETAYVRVCQEGPVFDGRTLTEDSFVKI